MSNIIPEPSPAAVEAVMGALGVPREAALSAVAAALPHITADVLRKAAAGLQAVFEQIGHGDDPAGFVVACLWWGAAEADPNIETEDPS